MNMRRSKNSSTAPEEIAARSGMYRLLARLWLREVDRNLLRELCCSPLCNLFTAAGGALPGRNDESTLEQLAIDYCRLFVGPTDHLPPYQSVWQTGQFHGATAVSMRNFVDVVGYNAQMLPAGMMLDHLGVQLDVMGHILGQVSNWQSEENELDEVMELSNSFFARHLLWPTELLQTSLPRAATDFYRSSIQVTHEFLKSELQE
jgi:TorA maturation chaperone TorD